MTTSSPATPEHGIDWDALSAPFPVAAVKFRVQRANDDGRTGWAVAYIDARTVQDRLDAVLGPSGWGFEWEPILVDKGVLQAAKGTLTIGGVAKSDIGEAGQTQPTKSCVSNALKRAAVQWGIGRYLYRLGDWKVAVEKHGRSVVIPSAEQQRLRQELARRTRQAPPQQAAAASAYFGGDDDEDEGGDQPQPRAATTPSAGGHLDMQGFCRAVQSELGINPKQAMERLGVKSLAGLNYDEAMQELRGGTGATAGAGAGAPPAAPALDNQVLATEEDIAGLYAAAKMAGASQRDVVLAVPILCNKPVAKLTRGDVARLLASLERDPHLFAVEPAAAPA